MCGEYQLSDVVKSLEALPKGWPNVLKTFLFLPPPIQTSPLFAVPSLGVARRHLSRDPTFVELVEGRL